MECGREMKMSCITSPPEVGGYKDSTKVMQVTIRDITLDDALQRKGLLKTFVQWLLEEKALAVQLESVQPEWMKRRCEASPYWIRQTPENTKDWNPSYVRLSTNTPFTLF